MGQQSGQTTTTQVMPDPFAQQSGQNLFNAATGYLNQFGNQQVAGQQPFSAAGQNMLAQGLLGYNPGFQMPSYGPSPSFLTGPEGLRGYSQTFDPLGGQTNYSSGYGPLSGGFGIQGGGFGGLFGGGSPLNQAQQIASGVGGYQPQQINPQQSAGPNAINVQAPGAPQNVNPSMVQAQQMQGPNAINVQAPGAPNPVQTNFGAQQVQGVNAQAPGAVAASQIGAQNVAGGSFLGGPGIGAYQNPYNDQVVDAALGDIDRSRQLANQQGARSADASTYGGDRNALIEAETNRGYGDAAARTAAQLRSQGFDTAAGLYGQDLNRGLQAGLANQGAGLQAGMANQGAGLQAALANQGIGAQFGLANAQNQMQAQMANQGAGLQASALGLQGMLANQAAQQQAGQFGASLGFDQQAQNAANQMQAGQFNASNYLQAQLANQGAGLQAGMANQQAQQQAGQFGASLNYDQQAQNAQNQMQNNQFNASNWLQAMMANQGAGLQGAGLNLDAAGVLGGLGGQQFNQLLAGSNALNQYGLQNQQLAQQYINQPLNNISYLNQLLQGNPFGGQSQYQTLPGGSAGSGFGGGALAGAGVGSMFGPWGAGIGALGGGLLGLFR